MNEDRKQAVIIKCKIIEKLEKFKRELDSEFNQYKISLPDITITENEIEAIVYIYKLNDEEPVEVLSIKKEV